jgi:hypothetical protein
MAEVIVNEVRMKEKKTKRKVASRTRVQKGISAETGASQQVGVSSVQPYQKVQGDTMKAQQMLTGRGLHGLFQQARAGSFRVKVHQIVISRGNPRTLSLAHEDIYKAQ